MKSQHTHGPWIAHSYVCTWGAIHSANGVFKNIALVPGGEADASLIAAAPEIAAERDRLKKINAELLFKLISAANYIDKLGGDSKPYRAAMAKAKGGAA